MPASEAAFRIHGYSGPCPKPPLSQSREPYPGEIDRVMLEQHVEALKDKVSEWEKSYDEIMQSNADLRGRLRLATSLLERFRDCRKHGVGMPQMYGTRIYLDDDVDRFLDNKSEHPQRPGYSAINALRAIAAQESDDPVLSNLIHGIRYGLKLAEESASESPLHPTQMD